MQKFLNQGYNIPIDYLVENCESICLDACCGDTMRLIPSQSCVVKSSNSRKKGNSIQSITNSLHHHKDKFAKISDILSGNYDSIKLFTSNLKKLQDFTSILVIIENSFVNVKQQTNFNYKDKEFSSFCVSQAQKISSFYLKFDEYYFHQQLRNYLMQYKENLISYKEFNVKTNQLIQEFNIIENLIYSPIVNQMNKGISLINLNSNNLFEQVKKYANSITSHLIDNLRRIILNHSNRLENITYFSLLSFQYLQVLTRIYKKYYLDVIQQKEKQNLIEQLLKYAKYFINQCDIQNACICFNDSLELNPQITDIYLQLTKLFKKLDDQNSVQITYQLALLQFPQKTMFLAGLLDCLNISQQNQIIFIKEYQNMINLNLNQGEYLILSQLFKDKDSKTENIFYQNHQSDNPQDIFNNLRNFLLLKNSYSKNLNPLSKIQEAIVNNQDKNALVNPLININMTLKKNESTQILKLEEIKCKEIIQKVPTKRKIIKRSNNIQPLVQVKMNEIIEIQTSDEEQDYELKSENYLQNNRANLQGCKQVEQIQKKFLKIVKNPDISKNTSQVLQNLLSPLEKHLQSKIKQLSNKNKELIRDSSTAYSSTSNVNLSRSSNYNPNFIEILSSSNLTPSSSFIQNNDSIINI